MSTFLKHLLSFLRLAHNLSQTMQSLRGPHTFPSRNVSIRNSAKLFLQKWKSFFSLTCKIVQ